MGEREENVKKIMAAPMFDWLSDLGKAEAEKLVEVSYDSLFIKAYQEIAKSIGKIHTDKVPAGLANRLNGIMVKHFKDWEKEGTMGETEIRADAQIIIEIVRKWSGKPGIRAKIDQMFDESKAAMEYQANLENKDPNQKKNSPLLIVLARKLLQMTVARNVLPTYESASRSWFDDLGHP